MPTGSRRNRRRTLTAGAAALGAVVAPNALAATITVNSTADTVAVDTECTLREALLNANDNAATSADCTAGSGLDTIDFAGLTLPAIITLDGASLPITDAVILDGPGMTDLTISGDDLSRIFSIEDSDSGGVIEVTIDDMTLTDGNASQESLPGGGAIFNAEDLTLTNVTLSNNAADAGGAILTQGGGVVDSELTVNDSILTGNASAYGGAILANGAIVTIAGSDISNNESFVFGGAMLHSEGSFSLTNTTVSGNTAPIIGGIALYGLGAATLTNATVTGNTATLGHAGGLYFYGTANITIQDSLISGNEAAGDSGGIKIAYGGPIVIRDTTISGNIAGTHGGGLYLYGSESEVTLERVRVTNNTAALYDGGIAIFGMTAHILESEISGNEAGSGGGGLYAGYDAALYLINSTIAGNTTTSGSGGGLVVSDSFALVELSTISGNTATLGAGGNVFVYGSSFYMSHSIIADGTATVGNDLVTTDSSASINWSLIEDPTGATFGGSDNIIGVDPQLGPLQNNGGPTRTMKPASTSPVVNSGDPIWEGPPNDQRGFPRPIGIVDRGAVELNPGTLALSSDAYSVNEAAGVITITVNRTGGDDGPVSVNYSTSSGTAISGADFLSTSGTLNWADDDLGPKTFNIPIANDTIFEGNETFNVALDTVVNATLGTSSAVVTIIDNDTQPTVSISTASATEGNAGNTPANFTVTLSNPTTQTVTVDFATSGGTAISGTDFAPNSGTITFDPLVTSQPLAVQVIGDVLDEPNETFDVTLTNPTNATLGTASGTGTIIDDDGASQLTIGDVTLAEGNAGTTNFVFNVTLAPASGQTVTVDYSTAGIEATSGLDFLPASGTLTFNPGVTSQQITVTVNGDLTDEINERFNVNLTNAVNATLADASGLGTIADDDASGMQISDVTLSEGSFGTTNFVFFVTMAGSTQTVTVDYTTVNGTAIAGSDYAATAGTLTFNPGETSQQITVPVVADTTFEPNETFTVVLSNAPLAQINDDTGAGTIVNDDAATADLGVTKTVVGTGPFIVGDNATFTITVTNAGPGPAEDVRVVDVIPAGTTFVSATPSVGACTAILNVNCELATLANDDSATITIVLQLTAPGTVINTATATSDSVDPTPAAGTAQITVNAAAAGEAIPTLNEWMLIALASALAAAAALKLRP